MKPKTLYFLENGQISLELQAVSIIDIENLIKLLIKNIFSNKLIRKLYSDQRKSLISEDKMGIIQKYAEENVVDKYKENNAKYLKELKKIQNFRISILSSSDLIGIQEIYLKMPYIMKGVVINENVSCLEINIEHLEKIIKEETQIIYDYVKQSINKVLFLIERLQTIKQNNTDIIIGKLEKEFFESEFSKIPRNIALKTLNKKKNKNKSLTDKKNTLIRLIKENSKMKRNKEDFKQDLNCNFDNNDNNLFDNNSPLDKISTNLNPLYESMLAEIQKNSGEKINMNYFNLNNNTIDSNIKSPLNLSSKINNNLVKDNSQIYITLKNDMIRNKLKNINIKNINGSQEVTNQDGITLSDKGTIISNLKKQTDKIGNINYLHNKIKIIKPSKFYHRNYIKKALSCSELSNLYDKNNSINQQDQNNSTSNKKSLIKIEQKCDNFQVSYVPLNVLSPQNPTLKRNYSSKIFSENSSNNNTLSTRQSAVSIKRSKFFSRKISKKKITISKSYNSNTINQVNLEYDDKIKKVFLPKMIDVRKFMDPNLNLKKIIVPEIVKNFYKQIKKRGYSSIINNKDHNTYLNKSIKIKRSEKEDDNELNSNEKINKNNSMLPKINNRYSSKLSAISVT